MGAGKCAQQQACCAVCRIGAGDDAILMPAHAEEQFPAVFPILQQGLDTRRHFRGAILY